MIFRNWVMENFPFLEDDFDALTDYELFCKMLDYCKKLVADNEEFRQEIQSFETTVNNEIADMLSNINTFETNTENRITNFENSTNQEMTNFENSVNSQLDTFYNYFNNLDVQEEINNKLDEMVTDGTLENLISSYLSSIALYNFNTVSDMLSSPSLSNGSFAKTYGYTTKNDGGGATYFIRTKTSGDIPDNMFLLEMDDENLVAELYIDKELSLKQIGATSSDEDISELLQAAINKCKENHTLIIDDLYNLTDSVTINRPIRIIGKTGTYANWGNGGFKCSGDLTFFNIDEGCINSTFDHLSFIGSKTYETGYEGTCIKFSSRKGALTDYRVWKNVFSNCYFNKFALVLNFYATGTLSDYDFSSEMLFLACKFLNNTVNVKMTNKQSYNINMISTDFEAWNESTGIILNTESGINFDGCSIILRGNFIKLERNTNINPDSAFTGNINIANSRFEIFHETIFNYKLEGGAAAGLSNGDNNHGLNVINTEFFLHSSDSTFLYSNVKGLHCNMDNITFSGIYTTKVYLTSSSNISEYSRIFINTAQPEKIVMDSSYTGTGAYQPWFLLNGKIMTCCVVQGHDNNYIEYNNKILIGYQKAASPTAAFTITVPWNYRKFKININGAFMTNSGTITITNSDSSFTQTFTKSTNTLADCIGEILLPYKADGDTYTITASNIWGNCYFE